MIWRMPRFVAGEMDRRGRVVREHNIRAGWLALTGASGGGPAPYKLHLPIRIAENRARALPMLHSFRLEFGA